MRNAFLALLLANLLLLGWLLWVDPEPPLASRWPMAMNWRYTDRWAPVPLWGRVRRMSRPQCVYIGPVPDASAAQQLSVALAERGIRAQPVPREGRVWLGHWVQVQGFSDKEQAEAARQQLLGAGLPDAYVMQDGSMTIISLGVFRERGRADRVIEAARRAGFKAVMRERVKAAADEYWLVSDHGEWPASGSKDLATGYDRILRAETCPMPHFAGVSLRNSST